eukprot:gnl/TRDRNA2_/TRDRNA2_46819_c0_seq1.p1 gnl/TRDRNA2_/TRDRNA2_46819_c0~~gnl/TRDRNA2_/TRDRNA2_46819_c0_seq1.p1  ORF type:complete len:109 (-),score=25.38 gnl/TRDRNA2_/TRDRNA2_46819_c0_seq1:80-406(-)
MDTDNSNTISVEELKTGLADDRARAHLQLLGIDVQDTELFFSIFTAGCDDTQELEVSELAEGAMKAKGFAKAMDLQMLVHEVRTNEKRHHRFEQLVSEKLQLLCANIQ